MKFSGIRSTILCAALACWLPPQNQLEMREVPIYYSGLEEDFDRFSVWQRGGEGGTAEPVYDGIGGSRALLLKADTKGDTEVFRLLNPYERWEVIFHVKDLTEHEGGSWLVGLSEAPEKSDPMEFKRAYFAGIAGFDLVSGVYSERDDDIKPVLSRIKKDRGFHAYSIKCAGSNMYFSMDGDMQGYVPGEFKPGKIFARVFEGGHVVLDDIAFKPQ